jgi:predicted GH43/DUF377 family glycosyl hydrolase
VRNDTVFLLYRAEDKDLENMPELLEYGLAWSVDGLHFKKLPEPVLYPNNDESKKWEWREDAKIPAL